ncbi:arf-GAP with Rho-GAP domain, ANK repeat and PH domain-containing protein 1-like isoform X2 [Sinocyclocheilus anshuiensis]|uniref:arf-GAP with Rho-GAP domain, ANK repeat and PH domain-containing protein 1-like isoform X2 n=1 Tax=Sinocyclocheilus anshuiensis TaxID=1608454 RepID=UPI0007B9843F|nr:PREDICTED: arf-GAP with Rho-GAP domain, ANK repeat and PH domain-containing protein 1-like isoform X2 [Sinocyclocheilus anshuiensis]
MSSVPLESSQLVEEWLNALRLNQYCSVFQEVGLGTLWECQDLSSAQLQQMGVALPGHRKRILGSLHKLFPSAAGMEEDEEREEDRPVARERTKFRRTAGDGATENSVAGRHPPPVPPRVTPNRPPVPFTPGSVTMATAPEPISIPEQKETATPAGRSKPIPTPRPRPEHLPLKGPAQQLQTSERKPSCVSSSSSSSSECFHLYEQCSSPTQGEVGVPPLPPKSYAVGVSKEPRDVPYRPPVPPPRVCSTTTNPRSTSSGSPPTFSSPADDPPSTDRVPDVPFRMIRPPTESSKRDVPPPPLRNKLDSDESSDEYDEREPSRDAKLIEMASKMSLMVPKVTKPRYSSLCSDDELLDDETNCYESVSEKRGSWIEDMGSISGSQNSIYLPNTGHVSAPPPREDLDSTSVPVIKVGWLDKNPPQGCVRVLFSH